MADNVKQFWKEVMPACVSGYAWGKALVGCKTQKSFEEGLKGKIKSMDDGEFDLFTAGIVMESARKQIMGVDLTAQIGFLRDLRK